MSARVVLLAAVTVLGLTVGTPPLSHADHGPRVGIDTDVSGNTATSLGPNDSCISTTVGQTFAVDLWAHDITAVLAFQGSLYYDFNVVKVVSYDINYLLGSIPGANLFDVSEPVPDQDGLFVPAFLDLNSTVGATGSGVMVRVTLEAVGAGYSPLFPTGNMLLWVDVDFNIYGIGDVNGDAVYDGPTDGAIVWVGQACPPDADGDGVDQGIDNCPATGNPDQADRDGDGTGDWCDDGDGDGNLDTIDTCPNLHDWSVGDTDGDGLGDACDADRDGDGVPNTSDNVPDVYNPTQADSDGDGVPDAIDNDADGDGINDKGAANAIWAYIGGDPEDEYVAGWLGPNFVENRQDNDGDVDEVRVPVLALGGTVHTVDLDGDGELEVSVKDPGRPPGVSVNYDMLSGDPDTDVDVVVIGGGELGALVPAPEDVDGDGEKESLVWEPELMAGVQVDAGIDGDGDVDIRWRNGQVSGMDNCPAVANAGQANTDADAYGDACDSDDDNDGYADVTEAHVGTGSVTPCGTGGWPADLTAAGGFSANKVNISDLGSFVGAPRYLNTNVGTNPGDVRWDVVPGSTFGNHINIVDMQSVLYVAPPMFGGSRAFNGPACTP